MKSYLKNWMRSAVLVLMGIWSWQIQAQCTPDQTLVSATNYPSTWKGGCVGQPYSETVQISFPIDSVVSGVNVVFDYFEIIGSNLPPGLTYSTNTGTNRWTPSNTPTSTELMFGCVTISGIPTAPFSGTATLDIEGCGTVVIITQCSTEVVSFNVEIEAAPSPSFTSMNNLNTVSFLDQSSTSGAITSWLWNFGDGSTSTDSMPSHTYASTGTYNVCLSVVTDAGCSAQSCDSVSVTMVSRDTEVSFLQEVELFPNPAKGQATLKIAQATHPEIHLRSLDGRELRNWKFSGFRPHFSTELDLNGLASGSYFIDIRAKEGRIVKALHIH